MNPSIDPKGEFTFARLLPNASVAATANTTAINITNWISCAVVVDIGVASAGSSPTLDVKIQSSATSGGTYVDVPGAAITQATTTTTQQLRVDPRAITGPFIRAVLTIGGTSSPAFPTSIVALGNKKVQ